MKPSSYTSITFSENFLFTVQYARHSFSENGSAASGSRWRQWKMGRR